MQFLLSTARTSVKKAISGADAFWRAVFAFSNFGSLRWIFDCCLGLSAPFSRSFLTFHSHYAIKFSVQVGAYARWQQACLFIIVVVFLLQFATIGDRLLNNTDLFYFLPQWCNYFFFKKHNTFVLRAIAEIENNLWRGSDIALRASARFVRHCCPKTLGEGLYGSCECLHLAVKVCGKLFQGNNAVLQGRKRNCSFLRYSNQTQQSLAKTTYNIRYGKSSWPEILHPEFQGHRQARWCCVFSSSQTCRQVSWKSQPWFTCVEWAI